tara:strand:+ start:2056 stop:2541 length:486 start_codon:yes stop_codon:yes gene_type:complete
MSSDNDKIDTTESLIKQEESNNIVDESTECCSDNDEQLESEDDVENFDMKVESNNKKFIVSIDYIPKFYCDSLENARKLMWEIAREKKRKIVDNTVYIYEGLSEDEICISVKNKYLVVSYEQVVNRLCVDKVHKVVETCEHDNITKQEESEKKSSWQIFSN